MAKKKKHRKTRKQKLARASQQQIRSNNRPQVQKDSSVSKDTQDQDTQSIDRPAQQRVQSTDISSVDYVKKDVKSSLLLAAIIIAVFGLLYVLLAKTELGTQVYSIIKL